MNSIELAASQRLRVCVCLCVRAHVCVLAVSISAHLSLIVELLRLSRPVCVS